MSGIAGIYNLDGRPVDCADLRRMVAAMQRRGPDGTGVWSNSSVGLGHCMLYNTPESLREKLPATNRSGDLAITADVRLDNRGELISALDLVGHLSSEITDNELILAAYGKWGSDCPKRLLGDFAFAIWDGPRRLLFCARDHFGVKPFNYYLTEGLFVFASDVKALLALRQVPRRINEERIADYLIEDLEGIDKTCTFYQDILRLPPAHVAIVGCERKSFQSYWSLDASREINLSSNEEYTEAFRDIFTEAVRCRLRSAGSTGSMLSGGLDSSAIVAVAKDLFSKNGGGRLHTVSAISEDADNSETKFINSVLSLGGFEAHTVRSDQLSPFGDELHYIPKHTDNLFDNDMILPQAVYIAAHKRGIKVLLDGLDGDCVASHGTGYLVHLLRGGEWKTAILEAIGTSDFGGYEESAWQLLYKHSRTAFIPPAVRRFYRSLRPLDSFGEATKDTVINIDFARRIGLKERLQTMARNTQPRLARSAREAHIHVLNAPFLTAALERYDRVAAAYSVEALHPLFDKRVVEFCLAIPWHQKVYRGWTKILLRRATAKLLPDEVCWRKTYDHLGQRFVRGTLVLMRGWMDQVMLRLDDIGEYVNVPATRKTYQQYLSQDTIKDGLKCWTSATLALWLERTVKQART